MGHYSMNDDFNWNWNFNWTNFITNFTPRKEKFWSLITSGPVIIAFTYSIAMIIAFATIYFFIGHDKHFEHVDKPIPSCLYTSLMNQTGAMGDVEPKTSLGRWLMSAQVFLGWVWFLLIAGVV